MGSRGTSRTTDYSGMSSSGQGGNGGASGNDPCKKRVEALLEDVARCSYFKKYNNVPAPGSKVILNFNGSRLVICDSDGEEIGYLPIDYNYLLLCINQGVEYSAGISLSRISPIAIVKVDIKS